MRRSGFIGLAIGLVLSTAAIAGGKIPQQYYYKSFKPPLPAPALQRPSVLAPYRFLPPTKMTPLEQQKALDYQARVRDQTRGLQQQQDLGRLDPQGQRLLMDSNSELDRLQDLWTPVP